MEETSILEPPRIKASSKEDLEEKLSTQLLHRSRGSYWLGELTDDKYTLDVHHSYYIYDPDQVRCVHDLYPRIASIAIKKMDFGYETRFPSMAMMRERFREAEKLQFHTIQRAVTSAYSPIVAVVSRTAGHLGKFEDIYVNRLSRGKRLFPSKQISRKYIVYLESKEIIEGTDELGYVLTASAINYMKEFRKKFTSFDQKHTDPMSPVPFLSLCIDEWEYLGSELKLTTITTYFRLLTSIFDHHFRAKAEPNHPQNHSITLEGIKKQMRRFRWGQQNDNKLRPRLQHLKDVGVIHFDEKYVVHMDKEWYSRGHDEVTNKLKNAFKAFSERYNI